MAPPAEAHVAVSYKGRWFWIAETDLRSAVHDALIAAP
jgi:hypothetical protein